MRSHHNSEHVTAAAVKLENIEGHSKSKYTTHKVLNYNKNKYG